MLLGEDLLLVMCDARGRTLGRMPGPLAGALVWDLARVGAIRMDEQAKWPELGSPPPDLDPLLRIAFDRIAAAGRKEKGPTVGLLRKTAGPALRERLGQRGLLAASGGPVTDQGGAHRAAVVTYLQRVIAGEVAADPRSAALIALATLTGAIQPRVVRHADWARLRAVGEDSAIMKATRFVSGSSGKMDWLFFWNN